jgi:hypothetical protein
MSIMTKAAAVLALGAVVTLVSNAALANTKGPSGPVRHGGGGVGGQAGHNPHNPNGHRPYDPPAGYHKLHPVVNKQVCYWLPTIGGGTVTGLEQKCYWTKI